jgi:hypothetical protein
MMMKVQVMVVWVVTLCSVVGAYLSWQVLLHNTFRIHLFSCPTFLSASSYTIAGSTHGDHILWPP